MRLFHIVEPSVWAAAAAAGEYLPRAYDDDGFVHFSFAHQVARTANARYRDAADLVVVEIESDDVTAELRIEDSYGAGETFPHMYGPIPAAAAMAVHPLVQADGGAWVFEVPDQS